MKRNILYLLFAICFVVFVQSCKSGNTDTWVNGSINSDIKNKIAGLNKKLFTGIMTKDTNAVKALLSDELLKKSNNGLQTVINRSATRYNAKNYEVLDEYYKVYDKTNESDTLESTKGDSSDYKIAYKVVNKEMYISLLVTQNPSINGLIFAVYGKHGNDWKINILQIGDYNIFNKTAEDYYKTALEEYRKGNLVNATNMMILVSQLVSPGGNFFSYRNEANMKNFFTKVIDQANTLYQFPVIVGGVKSNPQIFSVSPQVMADAAQPGVFPLIQYKTAIKLTDTAALKAENDQLQKVITNIFQGIDQGNKNIFYQAYNDIPKIGVQAPHYGFIQKLK